VSALAIALIVFACVCGGVALGVMLRRVLPVEHFTAESRDIVKLGTGLVATMAALVLGLLIASAKNSFEAQRTGVEQMAVSVILLDGTLRHLGSAADEARDVLRRAVATTLERTWSVPALNTTGLAAPEATGLTIAVYDRIQAIAPQGDTQRATQAQALQITMDLRRTRWQLIEEEQGSSIPLPFLVVLIFWLTFLFVSFGLHAPPNATVIVTQLLCALSVSGAIYLVLDLDGPFSGLIRVSPAPLQDALARIAG
jgi:hypothetical protein